MELNLNNLRNEIDEIDKSILELFQRRMDLCIQVAEYKKNNNLPIFQSGREQEILDRVKEEAPEDLKDASASLIATIMEISKILQQRKMFQNKTFISCTKPESDEKTVIGCPGTFGSNSHTAALNIFPENNIVFYQQFEDVCKAIEKGEIEYGILPIHNTTAGSVIQTYDLLEKYDFYINATTTVEINHCFAARPETDESSIKEIYSHPQALSQCSSFIKKKNLTPKNYSNTALAAEMISENPKPLSAICSEICAKKFGLKIIKKGINDIYPNYTKFICITKDCQIPEDANMLSIALTLPNVCGSLYKILTKFFAQNINMQHIESRPLKNGSFDVRFHIDFEGNINDPKVISLLYDLSNNTGSFKFIGNYSEII